MIKVILISKDHKEKKEVLEIVRKLREKELKKQIDLTILELLAMYVFCF